jgi:hypothetical protein
MRHSCNPKHYTLVCSLAAAALLCAGSALAAGEGFYVAGSIGQSHEQYDTSTYAASTNNVGYEVAVGFKPLPMFAGEIDYDGFARAFGGPNYVDTYSVGAFALGIVPIPVVQLFGKVGVIDWRSRAQAGLPDVPSFHRTGSDLAYGVGAGTNWGRLGARLQFEKFDVAHSSAMDLTSVGLTWTL